MTAEVTDTETPVAHVHGDEEHSHPGGEQEHSHEEPARERPEFTPDPAVQAYTTVCTLVLAHAGDTGPYQIVFDVTRALEGLGLRGVVTGVAATELRGDGGLIGM